MAVYDALHPVSFSSSVEVCLWFIVFGLNYLIYRIMVNLGAGLYLPTANANSCCYVWRLAMS